MATCVHATWYNLGVSGEAPESGKLHDLHLEQVAAPWATKTQ